MLLELKVSNFAIIENLHIQFQKGLNILTGETGAGKSVLLKSLSLLMGNKSSTESIRTGFQQATIEGSFDISKRPDLKKRLHDLGIDSEDDLLVVKRVLAEDKSRVYMNGSLSTLNTLRDLVAPLIEVAGHSAPLIEMTGQFENRNLMSKNYHLDLIDQYAGIWEKRTIYLEKYNQWSELKKEIENRTKSGQNSAQRLDFLLYQKEEISNLNLNSKDDQDLETEIRRLKNSSRIGIFVDSAEEALVTDADSAVNRIAIILKKAHELASSDSELAAKVASLNEAKILIEDVTYELRKFADKIDADPSRLENLEHRLSQIRKLQKKYGAEIHDILKALSEIESEISILQNSEAHIEKLNQQLIVLEKSLTTLALELHKARVGSAKVLVDSVNAELLDLNMKGVTFEVSIKKLEELNSTGLSDFEFMSKTSKNDQAHSLAKFASGGELSRILLSLKRVVGSSEYPRTYLFDEVDTGVSGPTAEKVGRKLKSIAKGQQVICVTHLPQVASFGDSHFYIQKSPNKTGVTMDITELVKKDRVQEIARLISGEKISKTSLAHAEELLSGSRS